MPGLAPKPVGRGVHDVGIARIHRHVGDPHLGANVQHPLPVLAAVGGAVHAALGAVLPRVAHGPDQHRAAVVRVDQDARDLQRAAEADVAPMRTAVVRHVHTVAVGDVVADVGFTGTDPDHGGVARIDRERPDRGHRLVLEERRPGHAAVIGAEHAAVGTADVVRLGVAGHPGHRRHTAAGERRTDLAEVKTRADGHRQQRAPVRILLLRTGRCGVRERGGEQRTGRRDSERSCQLHGDCLACALPAAAQPLRRAALVDSRAMYRSARCAASGSEPRRPHPGARPSHRRTAQRSACTIM